MIFIERYITSYTDKIFLALPAAPPTFVATSRAAFLHMTMTK